MRPKPRKNQASLLSYGGNNVHVSRFEKGRRQLNVEETALAAETKRAPPRGADPKLSELRARSTAGGLENERDIIKRFKLRRSPMASPDAMGTMRGRLVAVEIKNSADGLSLTMPQVDKVIRFTERHRSLTGESIEPIMIVSFRDGSKKILDLRKVKRYAEEHNEEVKARLWGTQDHRTRNRWELARKALKENPGDIAKVKKAYAPKLSNPVLRLTKKKMDQLLWD